MMITGQVVQQAGGDRPKLRDLLASGCWAGIMGNVKFETHEGFTSQNRHQMVVFQYQGDRTPVVYPPQAAKGMPVYPFPGWKR